MNKKIQITVPSRTATIIALASATSMVMSQTQIAVHPAPPELGYHPPHLHHDLVGDGIMLGLGLGALYGAFRVALEIRDIL